MEIVIMSMKLQNVVRFIPVVNIIVISTLWIRAYIIYSYPLKRFIKTLLFQAIVTVLINIPRIALSKCINIESVNLLLFWGISYINFLIVSTIAIEDQKNMKTN